MKTIFALLLLLLASPAFAGDEREIGAVSTAFKLIGPNHKIIITAFDDPKVKGVTCYVARPRTGGITGGLGLAEDPSLASVSCVQTGAITYTGKLDADKSGEEVFDESRSFIFKSLSIDRIYDKGNGSLVYVARTTRIIEGSPATSISVIAPMTWDGVAPQKPELK
ncbi:MAG: CreA family protein [Alphaproteobacteria bacterium]